MLEIEAEQNEKDAVAMKINGPTILALLKMISHLRDAFDSSPDKNTARSTFFEDHNVVKPGIYWKIFHDEISSLYFQVWKVFPQKFNDRANKRSVLS